MLVLSRAQGEKLVFPTIGMSLEILRVKGKAVRLGIVAPKEVEILREELAGTPKTPAGAMALGSRCAAAVAVAPTVPAAAEAAVSCVRAAGREGKLSHAVRNRLNRLALALRLYQKQLERGLVDDAETTLARFVAQFEELETEVAEGPEASDRQVGGPSAPAADTTVVPRRRALIVEDDSNECELLAGLLRISGFDVATAGDGVDALGYLESHARPDVMLVDMVMPHCDGPRTVSAVRDNPRLGDMKVFAISGTAPSTLGVTIGPKGIDRWFAKPVNPETLVREMRFALTPPADVAAVR